MSVRIGVSFDIFVVLDVVLSSVSRTLMKSSLVACASCLITSCLMLIALMLISSMFCCCLLLLVQCYLCVRELFVLVLRLGLVHVH